MIDKGKNQPVKTYSEILNSQRRDKYIFIAASLICCVLFFTISYQAVTDRKQGAYFVGENVSGFAQYVSFNKPEYRRIEVIDYLKRYTNLMYGFDGNTYKPNMEQALALGGISGPAASQVQFYKDNRYIEALISTNSRIQVVVDSIQADASSLPYKANVYARQTTVSGAGSQHFRLWYYVELENLDSRSEMNVYGLTLKNLTPFDQSEIKKD
jgi:hypothetical protein